MRIAGIRLDPERTVWVDAGSHTVSLLDEALVVLSDGKALGSVIVTPEQLLIAPEQIDGAIKELRPVSAREEPCSNLPGSDVPYLGSQIGLPASAGIVVRVNAVARTATVRQQNGELVELPSSELV
jgi:hypothetical protein